MLGVLGLVMTMISRATRCGVVALITVVVLLPTGCCTVTVYQPLKALQRPVVVDVAAANFSGSRVLVRCLPNKDMSTGDADKLCRNLATLFQQQGAEAESVVPRELGDGLNAFEGAGADFTIEIESKLEHADDHFATAWVSAATFTMLPSIDEQTFAQTVVVRGRDRSVLATDAFRARFVNYTGIGVWSINWLLDFFFRSDDQDMSGDEPKKDFSRDFYAQISQLAFNAKVRSDLMGLTTTASPASPVPPPVEVIPVPLTPDVIAPPLSPVPDTAPPL
jgi:hypothetical protein